MLNERIYGGRGWRTVTVGVLCLAGLHFALVAEAETATPAAENTSTGGAPVVAQQSGKTGDTEPGNPPGDLRNSTAAAIVSLESAQVRVRRGAARSLHVIDPAMEKEVVTALGRRIQDPAEDWLVKHEALSALRTIGSTSAAMFWSEIVTAFTAGFGDEADGRHSELDVSYRDAAASVLLTSGGMNRALPVFQDAKDSAAKRGALGALMVFGLSKKGQLGTDEEGLQRFRAFVLESLEDESMEVRKDAMQVLSFVVRDRKAAKTSADLETNLMVKRVLEKQVQKETNELLKARMERLLSYYHTEPQPGVGTIPLPPETNL